MAEQNETTNKLRGLTFGGGYHEVNAKYIQTNPRNSCPELILPNGKCRRKSGIEDRQTCQVTVLAKNLENLNFRIFLLGYILFLAVNETL